MKHAFDNFMPHGHCFFWRPEILWPMAISDVLTGFAYVTLTALLIAFARKRPDIPYRWIFWAFGAFILACGIGHFIDAWNVWHGHYIIQAIWRVITCIVSIAVAGVGVVFFPKFLRAPSTVQLSEAQARIEQLNNFVLYQNKFNNLVVEGVSSTRETLVIKAIKALDNNDVKQLKQIFKTVSVGASRFRLAMGDFLTHNNTTNLSNTVMKVCQKLNINDQLVRGAVSIEHDSTSVSKALSELIENALESGDPSPVLSLKSKDKIIELTIENKCEHTPKIDSMDIPYYTTKGVGYGLGYPYAKWVFLKHGGIFESSYNNNTLTIKIEFKKD